MSGVRGDGPDPLAADRGGTGMRAALTTLRVLEAVGQAQPAGVSGLSRALALPKSSVQRCLRTLAEAGWLAPAPSDPRKWVLTVRAWQVGSQAPVALDLREAALEPMQQLRDATEETIHLTNFILEPTRLQESALVIVERLDSTQAVRTYVRLGTRAPLHASCSGRAVLARFPDAFAAELLPTSLEAFGPTTTTDPARLLAELAGVRQLGYAVNEDQWRPGVGAVAAAVVDESATPLGALAISVPRQRFDSDAAARFGPMVRAAAERIGTAMQGAR